MASADLLEALEHARARLADAESSLAIIKADYKAKADGRKRAVAAVHAAVKEARARLMSATAERNQLAELVAGSERRIADLHASASAAAMTAPAAEKALTP